MRQHLHLELDVERDPIVAERDPIVAERDPIVADLVQNEDEDEDGNDRNGIM